MQDEDRLLRKIDSFISFTPAKTAEIISKGKWLNAPHLEMIDSLLIDLSLRNINKLIINMPPRHGKSELISKYFPFWYLGNFPEHKVILTSYEATFASQWGRKVRDLIDEHGKHLFGIEVSKDSSAVSNFALKSGGYMSCAGAGGPLTGKGADLLIIDDPVKNDAEANSSTIRQNIWDWFTSTAFTRLEPNGIIVIVMTRWHEDDLCGRISSSSFAKDWKMLSIPAVAVENDFLGRNEGKALWSKRFNIEKLNEIRTHIGSYWFSALYQQMPSPASAGIFRRINFKYFNIGSNNIAEYEGRKINLKDCSLFVSVDLAIKSTETSDFTVAVIFAKTTDNSILIIDIIRERFEAADHLNMLKQIYYKYKPVLIGIESVQYQLSLIQSARRAGLPVKELKADRDKVSRALAASAMMEAGKVYFNSSGDWLSNFEKELLEFPKSRHDDQADALAYACLMINSSNSALPSGVSRNRSSDRVVNQSKSFFPRLK